MVSIESVIEELTNAAARLLILMQEGDPGPGGFKDNIEWADEMFDAYEHTKRAIKCAERAALLGK